MTQIGLFNAATPVKEWSFAVKVDDLNYTGQMGAAISPQYSADHSFSTCSFPVLEPFSLSEGRHTITYYAGWQGQFDLAFRGEITTKHETYFVPEDTLVCAGFLRRTQAKLDVARAYYYSGGTPQETQDLLDQIPLGFEAIPITNDSEIIVNILEAYSITPSTSNHSIQASTWGVSGSPAKLKPILWEPGVPGWSIITKLDNGPSYQTFDGRTGAIYRRQTSGTIPGVVRHTFTQGVDIYDLRLTREYAVKNQVVVRGAMFDTGGTGELGETEQVTATVPEIPDPSPYIPDPPGIDVDDSINNDYIETVEDAAAMGAVRYGIVSQPLQTFTMTVPSCSDFQPGDAIAVATDRITTRAVIVGHTGNNETQESQFVLRGSTVADSRTSQQPLPAMVITVTREHVLISSVLTPVVLISADASASSDVDGTIASYAITIGATTYTTARATHLYTGSSPVAVNLVVTDNDGQSAALSQTVTWDAATIQNEQLHTAEDTMGAATTDGEFSWRTFAASVTAVAPIALGGTTCYGCSDGKIYRSTDMLATAPTLVQTLPAQVNCLWCNESLTSRWHAGLSDGTVWLSIDDGVTWTHPYPALGAAINDMSSSPANPNHTSVCSGASLLESFGGAWNAVVTRTGHTAHRFAAGFGKAYVGYEDGVIANSADATTITLPAPAIVRGLCLDVLEERLTIGTDSTATYRWTAAGGLVAGPTLGTACNRMMRSGTMPHVVYVASDGALGKIVEGSYYDIRLMS